MLLVKNAENAAGLGNYPNFRPKESCEDNKCEWPVEITWTTGLPGARIRPSVTKIYSGRCLLSFGLLKGGVSKGFDRAIEYGGKKAAAAGFSGVATAAGVATGPAGVVAFGSIAIAEVFKFCACEGYE